MTTQYSSQSGVLPWPSLMARIFQSWNVCSFLQYPSGLHSLMGSWLRSSFPGSLVFRCMAPSTGLSVHWVQGAFPYRCGSLPMGPQWSSNQVNFLSDNRSVVEIPRSGTSTTPTIMSFVCYLSSLAARHFFSFTAFPVRGKSNPIADSLSRFQFQHFRRLVPHADSILTQIPQQLLLE